jgi:hypothetical protein
MELETGAFIITNYYQDMSDSLFGGAWLQNTRTTESVYSIKQVVDISAKLCKATYCVLTPREAWTQGHESGL